MAKRRPTAKRDVFVNRVRGRITFEAPATTEVFETFNTGMNVGRSDPMKWILLGAFMAPNGAQANAPAVTAEMGLHAQLCIGTQDAILDSDDMQVIADAWRHMQLTTSGGLVWDDRVKFAIDHPIPVFAQALTIGIVGLNDVQLNGTEWYYEIQYLRASITQNEIVEYLAAFGQV